MVYIKENVKMVNYLKASLWVEKKIVFLACLTSMGTIIVSHFFSVFYTATLCHILSWLLSFERNQKIFFQDLIMCNES